MLGAGIALVPANPYPAEDRMAQQVVLLTRPSVAALRAPSPERTKARPSDRPAPLPRSPVAPLLAVPVAPEPTPAPPVLAVVATAPVPAFVAPAAPREERAAAPPLRPVDVAQVAEEMPRTLHVPQLREPGLVAGSPPTLAAKVDAMQVPLPAPPQLAREERAALLAEAPSEMTVRLGGEAVGKVAFRSTETGSIDVQLSGLLDLVAHRMAPEEYTRLRASAAASSYVPLDQLRAIGLSLRYDAVYDELEISA